MKKLITSAAILWALPASGQTQAQPAPTSAAEISGSMTPGVQQFDNRANSSKLTEYRDFQDGFYVPTVTFSAVTPRTGWFFDLNGTNVSR